MPFQLFKKPSMMTIKLINSHMGRMLIHKQLKKAKTTRNNNKKGQTKKYPCRDTESSVYYILRQNNHHCTIGTIWGYLLQIDFCWWQHLMYNIYCLRKNNVHSFYIYNFYIANICFNFKSNTVTISITIFGEVLFSYLQI